MIRNRRSVQEDKAIGTLAISRPADESRFGAAHATQAEDAATLEAAKGDLRHFAPIYERYAARLYAYCLRRLGDPQEAEDVTSAVFTRAMTGLHTYRGGLVAAWLFSIARHTVINHLKAGGRHITHSLDDATALPAHEPEPSDYVIQAEEEHLIRELVADLPAGQQDLLLMKLAGGLTAEEIGATLGKRPGAVRTALSRILHGLQRRFEDRYEGQRRRP